MCWLRTASPRSHLKASRVADHETSKSPSRTKTSSGKSPSAKLNSFAGLVRFWMRIIGKPDCFQSAGLNARPLTYRPVSFIRAGTHPAGMSFSISSIGSDVFQRTRRTFLARSSRLERAFLRSAEAGGSFGFCSASLPRTARSNMKRRRRGMASGVSANRSKWMMRCSLFIRSAFSIPRAARPSERSSAGRAPCVLRPRLGSVPPAIARGCPRIPLPCGDF